MQLPLINPQGSRTLKNPAPEAEYALLNEEFLSASTVKKTDTLLPLQLYYKTQKRKYFKQRNAVSIFDKYKIISTDLQRRLYTENPNNNLIGVTDTDKDYFSCINGRRTSLHIPIYKSLKLMVNNHLRIRHAIGSKKDCVLNIETNYSNELACYNLSVKRFKDQNSYFDDFISEDYKKSVAVLKKWEDLKNRVDLKAKELQYLAIEKFTIVSRLITLDYKYGVQLKYGRFLYYLSPPTWRMSNRDFARSVEIEAKGFDFGKSNEDDTFAVIFNKMYGICFSSPVKPVLYFTKPNDLMKIFNRMEEQQLYYFTHVNHLAPFIKELNNKIRLIKDSIDQDNSFVIRSIQSFENLLELTEDRCVLLKRQFLKILHGLFYDTIVAADVLKLNVNLEFCYQKITGDEATNTNVVSLTKFLENMYMDYSKRLDALKSSTLRREMNRYIEKEHSKIKKARNAAKELRLFNRLKQEMFRSYGISTSRQYPANKVTFSKSTCDEDKCRKLSVLSRKDDKDVTLTESEIEYLTLFTDWCQNDDPSLYLQGLKIQTKIKKTNEAYEGHK